MKKQISFLSLFLIISFFLNAQQPFINQTFQGKHHMLDSSELYTLKIKSKSFTPTPPPPAPVRPIAEWEQSEAVLVSYPGQFGIPISLIAEMSQDCKVITIVETISQQTSITTLYSSNGVNMSNSLFFIAPLNSYWVRDYGPWFIVDGNNEVAIVDFPYNRPSRPDDDNIPVLMANYLNVSLYGMDIIEAGGNYMSDGVKIAASTDLVTDENLLTISQIDALAFDFLGVDNYYITTDPLADYIKHIDCWGKFLDVDKILIASVSIYDSRYADYEAMATYWANETSSYGNKYQVYRVYEPNGQPYTNSLILNNKVFVPIVSGLGSSENAAALAVYEQAMPGYEIFGISSSSWESTDALHCRTHEVADRKMLYINHLPLLGEKPVQSQYLISADIMALSDSSLISDSIWINYKVNQGIWNKIYMTNTSGLTWQANIPSQLAGDTIKYYIHATDESPKSVTHPLIGENDPHKFYISTNTGIANIFEKKDLIFPNPANSDLFVVLNNNENTNGYIKIFNNIGKSVKEINISESYNKLQNINVEDLAAGSYYVIVKTDNTQTATKVMIIH